MADTIHGIARETPVILDAETPLAIHTTWGEFVNDNADGIEAGDIDIEECARTLLRAPGVGYYGGGGASAEWSIRLVD